MEGGPAMESASPNEQRREKRYTASLPVEVVVEGGDERVLSYQTSNSSPGGAFGTCPVRIPHPPVMPGIPSKTCEEGRIRIRCASIAGGEAEASETGR